MATSEDPLVMTMRLVSIGGWPALAQYVSDLHSEVSRLTAENERLRECCHTSNTRLQWYVAAEDHARRLAATEVEARVAAEAQRLDLVG
jgi:hypothetical protein